MQVTVVGRNRLTHHKHRYANIWSDRSPAPRSVVIYESSRASCRTAGDRSFAVVVRHRGGGGTRQRGVPFSRDFPAVADSLVTIRGDVDAFARKAGASSRLA